MEGPHQLPSTAGELDPLCLAGGQLGAHAPRLVPRLRGVLRRTPTRLSSILQRVGAWHSPARSLHTGLYCRGKPCRCSRLHTSERTSFHAGIK